MFMTVKYVGPKTFGNGQTARKYDLTISKSRRGNLRVTFSFSSPARGQNKSLYSEAEVLGGAITLPQRQALALASAILSHCHLAESEGKPVTRRFDEEDVLSKATLLIDVTELADMLDLEEREVTERAKKYSRYMTGSAGTHLPVEIAQKIQAELGAELSKKALPK